MYELALKGVRLWLSGEQPMAGPRQALTDEVREIIMANRDLLLRALLGQESPFNGLCAGGGLDTTPNPRTQP